MHDEILRKKEEQDREKPQRHLFRFPYMGMWTKLRPGIWNFLEKVFTWGMFGKGRGYRMVWKTKGETNLLLFGRVFIKGMEWK